jgi:DNA-binding CsgD family transcriptional regulator
MKDLITAKELKKLLKRGATGISQREMARLIDIDERTMRRYVAGDLPIPRVVQLAVSCIVDHDDLGRDLALKEPTK